MSRAPLTAGALLRLVRDVGRDRQAMAGHAEELESLAQALVAKSTPEGPACAAVALGLHHYYSALETCLSRVCRVVEGDLPAGPDWHIALIQNAALPLEPLRPALVSSGALEALSELRRFRHFLRNAYAVRLDPRRLLELCGVLSKVHPVLLADIDRTIAFLSAVAIAVEEG